MDVLAWLGPASSGVAWRVAWRGAWWVCLTSASVAAPAADGRRRAQSEVTWSGAEWRVEWHGECEECSVKCAPSGGAFGIGQWRGGGAGRSGGAEYSLVGGQQRSKHAMNEASSRRRARRGYLVTPAERATVRLCCWSEPRPRSRTSSQCGSVLFRSVRRAGRVHVCGGVSARAAARLNERGLCLGGLAHGAHGHARGFGLWSALG